MSALPVAITAYAIRTRRDYHGVRYDDRTSWKTSKRMDSCGTGRCGPVPAASAVPGAPPHVLAPPAAQTLALAPQHPAAHRGVLRARDRHDGAAAAAAADVDPRLGAVPGRGAAAVRAAEPAVHRAGDRAGPAADRDGREPHRHGAAAAHRPGRAQGGVPEHPARLADGDPGGGRRLQPGPHQHGVRLQLLVEGQQRRAEGDDGDDRAQPGHQGRPLRHLRPAEARRS